MKKLLLLGFALLIATSCVLGFQTNYSDASSYSVLDSSQTFQSEITELNLNWISGTANISFYDGDSISISESSDKTLSEEEKLHYFFDGSTLNIQFCKSNINLNSNLNKDLTVLIPKSTHLTEFSANTSAVIMTLSEIVADEVNLNIASGAVTGSFAGDINELSINSASGVLELKGTVIDDLSMNSSSGTRSISAAYIKTADVRATSGKTTLNSTGNAIDKLDLKQTSGSAIISIPENDGFTVNYSATSGSFNSDFEMTGGKKVKKYGNGSRVYDIKITSGSVNILKAE